MSLFKRKSSVALLIAIIVMLLLAPIWRMMLAPYIATRMRAPELEKIDYTNTMEGRGVGIAFGALEVPILIEAHAYAADVKGDNIILKVENIMYNMTNPDEPVILDDFSGNSTFVFNKFTGKNVPDAPEADKNRTGYFAFYPMHLKAGKAISDVWSESLNATVTLEFKESIKEEGVKLYKYCLNTTIEKVLWLPDPIEPHLRNCTLTSTKTILIEPLFGVPAYTENETFSLISYYKGRVYPFARLVTYKDSDETKAEGLENAKAAQEGIQLLELHIPAIFGAVAIILAIVFALNIRRLKRKKPPQPKTQPPPSP